MGSRVAERWFNSQIFLAENRSYLDFLVFLKIHRLPSAYFSRSRFFSDAVGRGDSHAGDHVSDAPAKAV
jgi:hypothetical protein